MSKWIAALEEEHGAALLLRSTRSQRLSDAGGLFYERAKEILAAYEELAAELDFVVALGDDLGEMQNVFSGEVDGADALAAERAIVVLTPQFSAALLARVAGGEAGARQYAYALVYDRGQVTRAARMLTSYVEL